MQAHIDWINDILLCNLNQTGMQHAHCIVQASLTRGCQSFLRHQMVQLRLGILMTPTTLQLALLAHIRTMYAV